MDYFPGRCYVLSDLYPSERLLRWRTNTFCVIGLTETWISLSIWVVFQDNLKFCSVDVAFQNKNLEIFCIVACAVRISMREVLIL